MKKLAMLLAIIILYFPLSAHDMPVRNQLNVMAPSGLKLRANPGVESQVLTIIPHRAVVEIIDNEISQKVPDVINYMHGYWIYIGYDGHEGYVFDGFLSSLPMPTESFEKTQFELNMIYPVESWLDFRHPAPVQTDTVETSLYTRISSSMNNGVKVDRIYTDQYYKLNTFLPDVQLSDVYYLLYNMLNDKEEQEKFAALTTYIKNREGQVDKINISLDTPVFLKEGYDGVYMEIKSFGNECAY